MSVLAAGSVTLALAAAAAAAEDPAVATVDGTVITRTEFENVLSRTARARYYHGAAPEDQQRQLRRGVADALVDRVLLLREARRRGIKPAEERIDQTLAAYRERYGKSPGWAERAEKALPALAELWRDDDLLRQLEAQIREVPAPDPQQLQSFYDGNHDKFTEPEQDRVSLILLKVEPSAAKGAWEAARREAADLAAKLHAGADFAEIARLRSRDSSAAQGGDMGYLHRGMLSAAADAVVARLGVGEISDPFTVLEGVAILKLDDRRPAQLRAFAQVRDRASELWRRERGEQAWLELKQSLRAASDIKINDALIGQNGPLASKQKDAEGPAGHDD